MLIRLSAKIKTRHNIIAKLLYYLNITNEFRIIDDKSLRLYTIENIIIIIIYLHPESYNIMQCINYKKK